MEDEHSQMSDEQLLAEYDKLLADVENGLVEASPAQVVELREKREAYVKSIDDEKTAIRNKALADARELHLLSDSGVRDDLLRQPHAAVDVELQVMAV